MIIISLQGIRVRNYSFKTFLIIQKIETSELRLLQQHQKLNTSVVFFSQKIISGNEDMVDMKNRFLDETPYTL